MAQTVDLLVHRGILLDIGIGMGDIRLRLIVVVVAYKILHRVFGKELPEFGAQLGSQGLVMGQDQGGSVQLRNHRSHGKGLAGAGDAQKGLLPQAQVNAVYQSVDGLGLVAGGPIIGNELEVIHTLLLFYEIRASVKE